MEIKVAFYRNGRLKKREGKKRTRNVFSRAREHFYLGGNGGLAVDKYQERDNLVRPIESNSKMRNKLDFCTYYYLSKVYKGTKVKEYFFFFFWSEMSMNSVFNLEIL